ncbi:hypothetical protein ACS0TY_013707 [Phlomoides rotata]
MVFAKAFVAKLLRDFLSREIARRVLGTAFEKSLKVVKQSLEEYSSPDFRGNHDETEAIQRLHFHTAMTNLKHVLWLASQCCGHREYVGCITVDHINRKKGLDPCLIHLLDDPAAL